jgi:hypothetical protein
MGNGNRDLQIGQEEQEVSKQGFRKDLDSGWRKEKKGKRKYPIYHEKKPDALSYSVGIRACQDARWLLRP